MKYFVVLMFMLLQTVNAAEVNVYSARKEALIKPLFDRFTEQTGIDVNMVSGKADALIKRMELEGKNSPADLLVTVDVGRLYRAKEAGVLQKIESDVLNTNIPANYRDTADYWYGLSLRSRVIVYNRNKVKPTELSTYENLTDEKWRKQICIRSSSNIYNQSLVASLIEHNGEQQTQAWAEGIVANLARSPKGGDRDQIKAVAAGQCKVAVVNTYYLAGMLSSKLEKDVSTAQKVALFWPNQTGRGAHMNISGAGVTASAKNRESAIRLLEFLISDEAQKWYADTNHEFPVKNGINSSELLHSWGEFKADSLNMVKLGESNAAAVKLMDRAGWK